MKKIIIALVMLGLLCLRAFALIKTPNLVGGWRFEGNANDWSGQGNNGTVYGATLTTGKFGQCYNFNGSSDYIDLGDGTNSLFDFGTGDFSISVWMKADNWSGYMPLVSNGVYEPPWSGFQVGQESQDGYVIDSVRCDIAGQSIRSSQALSDGIWYFVVLTRSSGTAYIYVDGVQKGSGASTGNVNVDRNTLIGRNPDTTYPRNFDGLIDEVHIYNRALTESEIRQVMMGYAPKEY